MSEAYVADTGVATPWGPLSELKKRKLRPGSGTPRDEVVRNQLPSLMPSFVFLITLPLVDQNEALTLSRRTAAKIDRALGG